MKKIVISALVLSISTLTWAQDAQAPEGGAERPVNKNGYKILPESGDFGLGFNAVPFLRYLGNAFNGNTNNSVSVGYVNSQQAIYGKYFLDNTTAIRAEFRFAQINTTRNNWVLKDGATTPDDRVEDVMRSANSIYSLGVGLEKRRGWGRLQALYGGQVFYGYSRNNERYTYGNEFSAGNVSPTTTTNFFNGANTQVNDRVTKRHYGTTHSFGARLFAGVEYYFAPKMSIGGEFGWGVSANLQGDGKETRERYTSSVEEYSLNTRSVKSFRLDTDNWNGAIALMIYF